MAKLTRRERSAINKAKFREQRGGRGGSSGGRGVSWTNEHRTSLARAPYALSVPKGWITVNRGEEPYQFKVIDGAVWALPYNPNGRERGPFRSYKEALFMVTDGDEPRSFEG